jgi:hypothetical protein
MFRLSATKYGSDVPATERRCRMQVDSGQRCIDLIDCVDIPSSCISPAAYHAAVEVSVCCAT